jgi:hypothetical protein
VLIASRVLGQQANFLAVSRSAAQLAAAHASLPVALLQTGVCVPLRATACPCCCCCCDPGPAGATAITVSGFKMTVTKTRANSKAKHAQADGHWCVPACLRCLPACLPAMPACLPVPRLHGLAVVGLDGSACLSCVLGWPGLARRAFFDPQQHWGPVESIRPLPPSLLTPAVLQGHRLQ